jgi:hypothetical protein
MGPARPRQLPGAAVALAAAGLVGAWWALVAPVLGQARLDSRAGVALVVVAFGGPAAAFAALAALARPGWARIGSGLLLAPASMLAGIAILPCLLLWSASSSWMAGREVASMPVAGGSVTVWRSDGGATTAPPGARVVQRRRVLPGLDAEWRLAWCAGAVDARVRDLGDGRVEVRWVVLGPDGSERVVTSRHRLRTFPTWSTRAPGAVACPGR